MSIPQQVLEPGWHPDPFGRHDWRYWDGTWTNHVADAATAPSDPEPPGAAKAQEPQPAPDPDPEPGPFSELQAFDHATAFTAPDLGAPPAGLEEATGFDSSLGEHLIPAEVPAPEPDVAMDGLPSIVSRGAVAVAPVATDDEDVVAPPSRWRRRKQLAPQHAIPGLVLAPEHHPVALPGYANPINFGRAGIVMLAAFAVAASAYLPWMTSTIGQFHYEQTGMETGHGWYFVVGGGALAIFALVAARFRLLRLAPLGVAIAMFATASSELVSTVDRADDLSTSAIGTQIHLGAGMFALMGFTALAVLASLRLASRH